MAQTILVTGSNGLVAQKTICVLLANGYAVAATNRGVNRSALHQGYHYHAAQLEDKAQVDVLFRQVRPEVVIHTAGLTLPDACERDPAACHLHNVVATANVADASLRHGSRLVYLSTDFVFDGAAGPYLETDAPNPLNAYGRAKLAAEQYLAVQTKLDWCVIRTILVYGYAVGVGRGNLVLWALQNLRAGMPIRVVADQ